MEPMLPSTDAGNQSDQYFRSGESKFTHRLDMADFDVADYGRDRRWPNLCFNRIDLERKDRFGVPERE
jgi:hypothetical protein